MDKVTVHQFEKYDINADGYVRSTRWATRDAIAAVRGRVLDGKRAEVDASDLGSEIDGMTVRNFNPFPRTGFQTSTARDR